MFKSLIYVGVGGFVGSVARYALHLLIGHRWQVVFPWSTFVVNITGCLIIGLLMGWFVKGDLLEYTSWKLLLITGFCGGYTTFSTFGMDGINLLQQGQTGHFFSYTVGSVLLGLAATYAGFQLVR